MGKWPKADATLYKKLSGLVYKRHAGKIESELKDSGFFLDNELSNREQKVFYNPRLRKAVVAYRGTDLRDPNTFIKDLRSDVNIAMGWNEETNGSRKLPEISRKSTRSTKHVVIQLTPPVIHWEDSSPHTLTDITRIM